MTALVSKLKACSLSAAGLRGAVVAACLVAGLTLASGGAAAQQPAANTPIFTWAAGVEGHYQAYREPSLGVSENGGFGGVTLDGRMSFNQWQLRGEGSFAYGRMDYSGSGTINGINDLEIEARIIGAYVFTLDALGDQLTPYFGYGYRRLYDLMGGLRTSTGAVGYDRVSQYHYLPIGLETLFTVASGWNLKPTVEYDYFIVGYQESDLSQVNIGLGDVHNTQHSGYGLRGSVMARTTIGSTPIEFGPFIRYWNIDRSNIQPVVFRGVTVGGGYEPANDTTEVGVSLKAWF